MESSNPINYKNVGDTHSFTLHDNPVVIKVCVIELGRATVWAEDDKGAIMSTDDFVVSKLNRLGMFMERAYQIQDTFLINRDYGYAVMYKGKQVLCIRESISAVEILI